jgi:hypothetical protein
MVLGMKENVGQLEKMGGLESNGFEYYFYCYELNNLEQISGIVCSSCTRLYIYKNK